jgi:hypothetical protein
MIVVLDAIILDVSSGGSRSGTAASAIDLQKTRSYLVNAVRSRASTASEPRERPAFAP